MFRKHTTTKPFNQYFRLLSLSRAALRRANVRSCRRQVGVEYISLVIQLCTFIECIIICPGSIGIKCFYQCLVVILSPKGKWRYSYYLFLLRGNQQIYISVYLKSFITVLKIFALAAKIIVKFHYKNAKPKSIHPFGSYDAADTHKGNTHRLSITSPLPYRI